MPTINLKKDGSLYIRIHHHGKIDTYQVTWQAHPFLESIGALPSEDSPKIDLSKDRVYEMLSKKLIFTEGTGSSDTMEETVHQHLPQEADPAVLVLKKYVPILLITVLFALVITYTIYHLVT